MEELIDMKTMIDELIKSGTGDDVLCIAEKIEEIILSLRIQLRQNIIEQQNRMIIDALLYELVAAPAIRISGYPFHRS